MFGQRIITVQTKEFSCITLPFFYVTQVAYGVRVWGVFGNHPQPS